MTLDSEHLPYLHAGREAWDRANGALVQCQLEPDLSEDPACSDSVPAANWTLADHRQEVPCLG